MTNRFDNVENKELRAWNRCAVIFNLMTDHGKDQALRYAGLFNGEDKKDISNMYNKIKSNGYEKTKAEVSRNVQLAS